MHAGKSVNSSEVHAATLGPTTGEETPTLTRAGVHVDCDGSEEIAVDVCNTGKVYVGTVAQAPSIAPTLPNIVGANVLAEGDPVVLGRVDMSNSREVNMAAFAQILARVPPTLTLLTLTSVFAERKEATPIGVDIGYEREVNRRTLVCSCPLWTAHAVAAR